MKESRLRPIPWFAMTITTARLQVFKRLSEFFSVAILQPITCHFLQLLSGFAIRLYPFLEVLLVFPWPFPISFSTISGINVIQKVRGMLNRRCMPNDIIWVPAFLVFLLGEQRLSFYVVSEDSHYKFKVFKLVLLFISTCGSWIRSWYWLFSVESWRAND